MGGESTSKSSHLREVSSAIVRCSAFLGRLTIADLGLNGFDDPHAHSFAGIPPRRAVVLRKTSLQKRWRERGFAAHKIKIEY